VANTTRTMLGKSFRRMAVAALAITGLAASPAFAQQYGSSGDPVRLTIGYQPYYTQAWSGVVMREKEFWKKYLPEGSTVDWQIGLQGSIIVNAMLAGRQHIGYMGDMPAIVSTTHTRVGDIRLVANLGLGYDQCNIFMVRADLNPPSDPTEALKWLDGKQTAVPQGACSDRYARAVFRELNIEPAAYMNQNIEVISSNLRANRLDAAVIWEPNASKLIKDGLARRMASGVTVNENDGGFLAMRNDLIEARPDVVKGWLNAELDAQLFIADPANSLEVAQIASRQTSGFDVETLWMSLYGAYPPEQGGAPVRNTFHFTFTPETMELISRATTFLHGIRAIAVSELRDEAIVRSFADEVLEERGLTAPVGKVEAQPRDAFPG
jgi:NitT/TauT family transport system substrate-binding protein